MWQETTFSWSIEYWRWRNDVLVDHWLKMGSENWSELIGSGSLPLWVGVRFDGVTPEMLAQGGWSLVTGWTYEQGGEVILQPRVFDLLSASTEVNLDDGKSVVIGGLTESTRQTMAGKVPMLGDIPYVGKLFSGQGSQPSKNDLMIFVTPRVVEPID